MAELRSKPLIVAKGLMFAVLVLLAAALLVLEAPAWRTVGLVVVLAWASARAYYVAFYVLERYVDPRLRYAGLLALLGARRNLRRCSDRSHPSR